MRTRLLLFLGLINPLAVLAAPSVDELTEIFMPALFAQPKLSPDGANLGFIARQGDVWSIGVYDFAARSMGFAGGSKEIVPLDFWWKDTRRLIVQTTSNKRDSIGYTALDADGKNTEDLWRLARVPGLLIDGLPSDPKHVVMATAGQIAKVGLDGEVARQISGSLESMEAWMVDELGYPRAALNFVSRTHGRFDLWWRTSATGNWSSRSFTPDDHYFFPQGVADDERYLLGWDFSPDQDMRIGRLDAVTGEIKAFSRVEGLDPTSMLYFGRTRRLVAAAYEQGPVTRLVALSESLAPKFARLEKQYEGYSMRIVDSMPDGKNWLVWIGSSALPGAFVLFNHETSESRMVALSHDKALTEERFAPGKFFTFPLRDGSGRLSGRLWRPENRPQPPLVVYCPDELPAGVVRDLYQPDVQALVLQGFAVLQVNGRNSWAFGKTGRQVPPEKIVSNLQEDLEDGVSELVRKKIVDGSRVGLFGAGFGGVLALQVAAHSRKFSAVATINAPREVHRDDLLFFTNVIGDRPRIAKMGGWWASEKKAMELSPNLVAPTLTIPALYLHDEEGSFKGRLTDDGRALRDAAKKAPNPGQSDVAYTWSRYRKLPSVLARENAEIYLKVASFFNDSARSGAR